MDNKLNCIWKDKKYPEKCKHSNHKNEKCHCDLEPCPYYEKKTLLNLFKMKFKNRRNKNG